MAVLDAAVSQNHHLKEINVNHSCFVSLSLSPASRGRGGRFSGEVPVFARRDSRLPAGQEARGQRSQQVPTVDAARDSVGGGLKKEKKNECVEEVYRESTWAQREGRKVAGEEMIAEITKTVNFFLSGKKRCNNLFFNCFHACTLLFFSA